jgi:cytochrome c
MSRPADVESFFRALGLAFALVAVSVPFGACRDPDRRILASLAPEEQETFRRGRAVALPCWTCHDLAGGVDKVGPSLAGLFGRRSGQAPDGSGSDALRAAAIVWDERTLAAFLRDPAGFVPGNTMVSHGVRDPQGLHDLLFYLRHVTRPGAREGTATP